MSEQITVLGGGSWGTALAWVLGGKGLPVTLWCRDPEQAAAIRASGENVRYVPGLSLPATVSATAGFEAALAGTRVVVVAVPTQAVRETLRRAALQLGGASGIAIAAKGLEKGTGKRLSEVAEEELGANAGKVAVLSGPNLSGEIIRKIPSATVIAARDEDLARQLQETFATPFFRVYTNPDLTGVELGGALKNPVAIAAGISDGLGFGDNTKASLLTRGLAEITRLGVAAGGRMATFSGLSGLGDLIATAHSHLSRNYRLGLALGQGDTLEHARGELHQVAEGVPTTEAACRLAERLGVEVPILQELRAVLYEGKPVADAVNALTARPYRDEGRE